MNRIKEKTILKAKLRLLPCVLFFSACQSHRISIVTEPVGAKISVYDDGTKTYQNLGTTPFELTDRSKQIPSSLLSSKIVAFNIQLPGYVSEHIFIDHTNNPKIDIRLKLKTAGEWIDSDRQIYSEIAQGVTAAVLSINQFLEKKRYDDALAVTDDLVEKYPQAYILWDLKGSIHFLNNQTDQARRSYKKSLSINPKNKITQKALRQLQ